MKRSIAILLTILSYTAFAQCEFPTSCDEITAAYTSVIGTSIDFYDTEKKSFCISQSDILNNIVLPGFSGSGVVAYSKVTAEEGADHLFVSASYDENTALINIYADIGNCDVVLVSSYMHDRTPEVVDIALSTDVSFIVEMIFPIEELLEDIEVTVSYSAQSDLNNCEHIDPDGTNPQVSFDIVSRSLGDENSEFFYPGETVTLHVSYPYNPTLITGTSWLHYIVPSIGTGWVYEEDMLEQTLVFAGFADVGEYYPESEDCAVLSSKSAPFFCTYDDNGEMRLCNMLTEVCPCETNSIEPDDRMPAGWLLSRTSNCIPSCSPSSLWGVGFTQVQLDFDITLTVSDGPNFSNDLSLGFTMFSDAVTGCYLPVSEVCIPSITNWAPKWEVFGRTEPYGFLVDDLGQGTICFAEEIALTVDLENFTEGSVYLEVKDEQNLVIAPPVLEIRNDTVINYLIENNSNAILYLDFVLYHVVGSDTMLLDLDTKKYLPKLELFVEQEPICAEGCGLVQVGSTLGSNSFQVMWSDGFSGFSRVICDDEILDTVTLIASFSCDSDTITYIPEFLEPITISVSKPKTVCKDGLEDDLENRPLILIDTVVGGLAPYDIRWNFATGFFQEVNVDGKQGIIFEPELLFQDFSVNFIIEDAAGCFTFFDETVDLLKDTLLDFGSICKDGLFDQMVPTYTVRLPTIEGKEYVETFWVKFSGVQGIPLNDSTFIINEELSNFTSGPVTGLQANSSFDDGCQFSTFYTVDVYNRDRAFDFSVIDFEVDFIPINLSGVDSLHWVFGDGNFSSEFFPTHIYSEKGTYNVTLTAFDECGSSSFTLAVMAGFVSTHNIDIESIEIYPNPASADILIKSEEKIDEVNIYLLTGQHIRKYHKEKTEYVIDISDLKSGVYLLDIVVNGSRFSRKVIKI